MTGDGHGIQIIHAGAAEVPVGDRKAGRFDDVGFDIETGAEPENRACILGDVRFVKGDPHGRSGKFALWQ